MLSPLRLQPIFKQRPWGGHQLSDMWHKYAVGYCSDWAESWEVADVGPDQSRIVGGPFDGHTLGELVQNRRHELLGSESSSGPFPLLLKFLDAAETLSVQVHPTDEQAQKLAAGEHGKSEAWVVLTAEPGSLLFVGLKPGIDRDVLTRHLSDGTVAECLHSFPARSGDVISVPAGTVHAIGAGVTLAELQQPSDLTLRLFDWNRHDTQGRRRELHVQAALDCINFDAGPIGPVIPRSLPACGRNESEELIRTEYFAWRRHRCLDEFKLLPTGLCRLLTVIDGRADIVHSHGAEPLHPGETLLIPAATDPITIQPQPACTLLDAEPC